MKKNLAKLLLDLLNTNFFKNPNDLLCSISGGQDSIFLLIFLYHLQTLFPISLFSLSSNHFWCINNFYVETELIKFHFLLNLEVYIFIPEDKILTEERGRFWRQKNSYRTSVFLNIKTIAMGHTFSDQIETSLWHLFRGTSPNGLPKTTLETYVKKPYFNLNFSQRKQRTYLTNNNKNLINKFKKKSFFGTKKNHLVSKTKLKNYLNAFCYKIPILKSKTYLKLKLLLNVEKYPSKKTTLNKFLFRQPNTDLGKISVIRPLISYHRNDLKSLITENSLPILLDKTNQSFKLTRNKIRLFIVPILHLYFSRKSDLQLKKYLKISDTEQIFLLNLITHQLQEYSTCPQKIKNLQILPVLLKQRITYSILRIYLKTQITYNNVLDFSQLEE